MNALYLQAASILFIRIITLGGDLYSFLFFIKLVFVSFLWTWVRETLPRFHYDKLMYLAWVYQADSVDMAIHDAVPEVHPLHSCNEVLGGVPLGVRLVVKVKLKSLFSSWFLHDADGPSQSLLNSGGNCHSVSSAPRESSGYFGSFLD
jgi:hypothetical protein